MPTSLIPLVLQTGKTDLAVTDYKCLLTHNNSRSPKFSLMLGLLFTGVALGPTLGGLLMRATGSVLSVFYAATLLHMLYAILIWVMVPESLTKDQMLASRTRHNQEIQKLKEAREGIAVGILVRIRRLFNFLSPLTLFVPKAVEGQNPSNWFKRDWSLLCTGLAYGFLVSLLVSCFEDGFQVGLLIRIRTGFLSVQISIFARDIPLDI